MTAKMAGVRIETISRILNNGPAKPSTRKKVEAAIEALNYKPNDYTRGLKLDRTFYVGLIIPSVWQPFLLNLLSMLKMHSKKIFTKCISVIPTVPSIKKENIYKWSCNIA